MPFSDQCIDSALQAADDALKSASEARTKTSKKADDNFESATGMLHRYGTDWHPCDPSCSKSLTVKERMTVAKGKDGSTSSILNTLKEKLRKQVRLTRHDTLARANTESQPVLDGPTTTVDFHLFRSLPDEKPIVVKREH
jgi:hypothetical protein